MEHEHIHIWHSSIPSEARKSSATGPLSPAYSSSLKAGVSLGVQLWLKNEIFDKKLVSRRESKISLNSLKTFADRLNYKLREMPFAVPSNGLESPKYISVQFFGSFYAKCWLLVRLSQLTSFRVFAECRPPITIIASAPCSTRSLHQTDVPLLHRK